MYLTYTLPTSVPRCSHTHTHTISVLYLHMQTCCTDTHLVTCTCTAPTCANILYQNAYEFMYTKLPQSCTKVVPIHYLCIVCPSPVHVQRLYPNINNSNSVLKLFLNLMSVHKVSTRTSTVPVQCTHEISHKTPPIPPTTQFSNLENS